MEKYGNKSPFMRFVHKNTGYIVVGIILAIAIPLYLDYNENATFYQKWSCPMMELYKAGNATAGDNPSYANLPEDAKSNFDKILRDEC